MFSVNSFIAYLNKQLYTGSKPSLDHLSSYSVKLPSVKSEVSIVETIKD